MKWIGLTGGLASGKSTVASLLRTKGQAVIDADQIAKDVVEKDTAGLKIVLAEFGSDLQNPDGSLDRRKLGQKVFGNPVALQKLESILHPLIQAEVERLKTALKAKGTRHAFYDVPLLFEKDLKGFDATIVVTTPEKVQRERMKARNGWSDDEITQRLKSQIPLSEKVKKATHVIHNDGALSHLENQVDTLLKKLV